MGKELKPDNVVGKECPRCMGTGNNDDSDSTDDSCCPKCGGTGRFAPPPDAAKPLRQEGLDALRDAFNGPAPLPSAEVEKLADGVGKTIALFWDISCPARVYASMVTALNDAVRPKDEEIANFAKLLDCRAGKLLLKGKRFVVVAIDEWYFHTVYATIRADEQGKGRWTPEDEECYLETMGEWLGTETSVDRGDPMAALTRDFVDAKAQIATLAAENKRMREELEKRAGQ